MEIKAQLRHLHIAPRKVRAVAGLIRGMGATDAERELAHLIKRSSDPLRKLLRSALANATHNFHLDEAGIRVKEIRIDPGPAPFPSSGIRSRGSDQAPHEPCDFDIGSQGNRPASAYPHGSASDCARGDA